MRVFGFELHALSKSRASIFALFPIVVGVLITVYFVFASSLTSTNVEPASLVAGATGSVTVSFTTTTTIPPNGKIVITFPSGYKVNTANGGACPSMNGTFTTTVLGQAVTLTRQNNGTGQDAAAETCTINNVGNPGISGSGGTYAISTTDAANGTLDTDASVSADIFTAGALTSASVILSTNAVGVTGSATASFTMANSLENNGKIVVVFPIAFTVSGANTPTCTMDGAFSLGVNSQTLTITRSGGSVAPSGAGFSCTIQGITNPGTPGATGTFSIQTTNNGGAVHDQNTNVAGSTIIVPTLTSTNVQPATLVTGASSTVTVLFTTTHDIPADGKIRITFPNGFGTGGANGGTCSSMNGTFATSVNGMQVLLTRQGDGGLEAIAPETCTINNVIAPNVVGTTGTYQIETLDNTNSVIDSDVSVPSDNILAATLTGTNVQPASLIANASSTVTVSFTTVNSLENNGKVQVIFPAGFNVVGASNPACSTMDGSFSLNTNGQTVTITRSGGNPAAPSAHTCTIQTITNPGATGATGTYTIQTTTAANQVHDIDQAVPGDTITAPPATLTSTNVQPAVLTAGSSSTVTASFTTTHAVPANGKIRITFAGGFSVGGAVGGACSSMNGTFVTSVNGQQVLLTRQNDGGVEDIAAETCTINNVINPNINGGTGAYQIETLDAANSVIDSDTAVPGDTIVANVLTGTNVQPASLVASATSVATISFTTTNSIESNGKVAVIFPAGFNVSGAGPSSCTGMDGSFTHGVSGQTVTIQRNGSTIANPGSYTCTLGNIVNPGSTGSTGTYTIQTMNSAGAFHDTDGAVPADTISAVPAQPLSGANVQPATLLAGAVGTAVVSFTTTTSLPPFPADGKIRVTFPSGFSLAGVAGPSSCTGMDGTVSISALGQVVTITRNNDGTGTGAPVAVSCTIPGVMNPPTVGSTGTYSVETTDASNEVIDADMAVSADTVTAALLTGTNVEPASLVAGAVGAVTVTFTTANALESNGKVKVTFPSAFTVGGVSSVSCSPSLDGAFAFSVTDQTVTILRNSGTTSDPGAKSCVVNGIMNPTVSGAAGPYSISTTTNTDAVHDIDSVVSGDTFTPGLLTGTNVQPASLVAGAQTTVTVSFTTANAIPNNGKIKVVFGSGFDVSGVVSGNCPTMDGSFSVGNSGQTVTLVRSGGSSQPASAETCTLSGVVNPNASGSTSVYTIRTTASDNLLIDQNLSVVADTIVAAELTGTDVAPASSTVGITNSVAFSFTTVNTVEADGKVAITFPDGYTVSSATSGTCSSMNGSFATSVAGQKVTITRSGGDDAAPGPQTCSLAGIANPTSVGTSGTYSIETFTAADAMHDADILVVGDVFYASSSDALATGGGATSAEASYAIAITTPTAGASYTADAPVLITWANSGTHSASAVDISYSADGGTFWSLIANSTPNDGVYSWTAPSIGTTAGRIKIEATDLVTVLATASSDAFTIIAPSVPTENTSTDIPIGPILPVLGVGVLDTVIAIVPPSQLQTDASQPLTIVGGMVIRGTTSSAVYYVNADGSLSPFPDRQTFFTYTDSFNDVLQVSDDEIASRAKSTPVLPKPGRVLVKIPTSNSVYALENIGGAVALRWIVGEAVATALYGSNWSHYVIDVLSNVWGNFARGNDVFAPSDIQVNLDAMQTRDELNSR